MNTTVNELLRRLDCSEYDPSDAPGLSLWTYIIFMNECSVELSREVISRLPSASKRRKFHLAESLQTIVLQADAEDRGAFADLLNELAQHMPVLFDLQQDLDCQCRECSAVCCGRLVVHGFCDIQMLEPSLEDVATVRIAAVVSVLSHRSVPRTLLERCETALSSLSETDGETQEMLNSALSELLKRKV